VVRHHKKLQLLTWGNCIVSGLVSARLPFGVAASPEAS
jgi:hypothetical protein